MESYRERADFAIAGQRWQEAEYLLTQGIAEATLYDDAARMRFQRLALPLHRDAVQIEAGRPSQLTDASMSEVYEETTHLLRRTYMEFDSSSSEYDRTGCVGLLAELSIFGFWAHARIQQVDEGLLLPASSLQDKGGKYAHDLGMYHPEVHWHNESRIAIQVKHILTSPGKLARYDPSVVVVAYKGKRPYGIDRVSVLDEQSAAASLAETTKPDMSANNQFTKMHKRLFYLVSNWPKRRTEWFTDIANDRRFSNGQA